MASLTLTNLVKRFGQVIAVDDLNLEINDQEFVTFLGPSGCGKTTTLRMIAGLEKPFSGQILFDGTPVTHLPANHRDIAMVFQSYALYPHMSVYDNIAFALKMMRVPSDEIRRRVESAAGCSESPICFNVNLGNCPVASGSASRSGARSSVRPPPTCWMSRFQTWMLSCGFRCERNSRGCIWSSRAPLST